MTARRTARGLRVERLEDRAVPAGAGTLDTTFGGGSGLVTAGAGTEDVAVTPDDKVITLAYAGDHLTLNRLLPDGQFDPSFNRSGEQILSYNSGSIVSGRLTLLPDGSVLVLGMSYTPGSPTASLVEFRVSADGTSVATRATSLAGLVPAGDELATTELSKLVAAIDPASGDVYVVDQNPGSATRPQTMTVLRLGPDLRQLAASAPVTLAPTATPPTDPFAPRVGAEAAAIGTGGTVYVLADSASPGTTVTAFTPDLTGEQTTAFDPFSGERFYGTGLLADPAGRVFLTGTVVESHPTGGVYGDMAAVRLDPATLAVKATGAVDFGSTAYSTAAVLDPAGRVVLAGIAPAPGQPDVQGLGVARLTADTLTPDTTFNGTGTQAELAPDIGIATRGGIATAVATDPAGPVVVAGSSNGSFTVGTNLAPAFVDVWHPVAFRLFGDGGTPPATITPAALPEGEAGDAYTQTLTATGPTGPLTFSVAAGTLPPGLALSAGGSLTGTPTAAGTYPFTVAVADPT